MKLPWKKNFLKTPQFVTEKLEQLNSDSFVVGASKKINKSDIENGIYEHISIVKNGNDYTYDPSVLPKTKTGRYSGYNVNGRSIPLKNLPKVPKSFTVEAPSFGDSSNTHEVTWDRMVYQKENWFPQYLNILIEQLSEDDETITFKFQLDTYLFKNDPNMEKSLLYHCNVLQENCGECNIFDADASTEEYLATLQVEWELLPPGNLEENVQRVMGRTRNNSPEFKNRVIERMEFLETLNPKSYILGLNKFSGYFGAYFEDNLVLLENLKYGNAIYILFEGWEELSKLSRTELLRGDYNFVRVKHHGKWQQRVRNELRNTRN